MIYTIKYPHSTMRVDTDKIAKKFDRGGQLFVHFFEKEDRLKLIEYLESEGFYCVENRSYSRRGTIESGFPLVIELNRKRIFHLGNVTCSAAAAQSGVIMSDKDFYTKMTDMIAKIAGNSVSDSRFFGWEPGMKMLYCDILLRLYFSENYYVAVQVVDLIFYILNMYDTGKVVAVAAAGASEDNCKAFLDKYYDRIDLLGEYETVMPGLVAEWL